MKIWILDDQAIVDLSNDSSDMIKILLVDFIDVDKSKKNLY
jgi:hypothetical protein